MQPKIKHHAYLVVYLDYNGTAFPTFDSFGIYSCCAASLTSVGKIAADVMNVEADSYAEAKDQLLETLRRMPSWWCVVGPWVDPSYEAHMARLDVWETRDAIVSETKKAAALSNLFAGMGGL